jgi:hypothetical protein
MAMDAGRTLSNPGIVEDIVVGTGQQRIPKLITSIQLHESEVEGAERSRPTNMRKG